MIQPNKQQLQQLLAQQQQQIEDIQTELQNRSFQALLIYAEQLKIYQKLQIALTFNQIFKRTCLQPQLINQIQPKKGFIKNLTYLTTMVCRKQLIYSIDNLTNRAQYLTNYFAFMKYIFDGNKNIVNQSLISKLLKEKKFIKKFFAIQLRTSNQKCYAHYAISVSSFIKLPQKLIPQKRLALNIIKNLKYLISHQFVWLPFYVIKTLLICNKNIINFTLIKKYHLISTLQIMFDSNKKNKVCVQSLDILIYLMMKFQNVKKLFSFQNSYDRFRISKQMKSYILEGKQFKQNYVLYFANSLGKIPKIEMGYLSGHFMSLLKDVLSQKEKLKQANTIEWLLFLLQIIQTMIYTSNSQERIWMLINNGIIEWSFRLLQLRSINQYSELQLINILRLFHDHLEKESPHHFNYYLRYSLNALQFINDEAQNWQEEFILDFKEYIKQKLKDISFQNLLLK